MSWAWLTRWSERLHESGYGERSEEGSEILMHNLGEGIHEGLTLGHGLEAVRCAKAKNNALDAATHGELLALHAVGVGYNVPRGNWAHVTMHAVGVVHAAWRILNGDRRPTRADAAIHAGFAAFDAWCSHDHHDAKRRIRALRAERLRSQAARSAGVYDHADET